MGISITKEREKAKDEKKKKRRLPYKNG